MTAAIAARPHLDSTPHIQLLDHWHSRRRLAQQKPLSCEASMGRRRSNATTDTSRIAASGITRKTAEREVKSSFDDKGLETMASGLTTAQQQNRDAYSSREDSTTSDDASSSSGWEEEATPRPPDFVPNFGKGFSPQTETTPRPSFLIPKSMARSQYAASSDDDDTFLKGHVRQYRAARDTSRPTSESIMRLPYSSPIGLTVDAFAPCNFDEEYPLFDFPIRKQMLKDFHRKAYRAELRLVLYLGGTSNPQQRTQMLQEHNQRMESLMHDMAGEMVEKQRKWRMEKRCEASQPVSRMKHDRRGYQGGHPGYERQAKGKFRKLPGNAFGRREEDTDGREETDDDIQGPVLRRGKPKRRPNQGIDNEILQAAPGRWRRQTSGWRLPTSAETSEEDEAVGMRSRRGRC